ncbi:MAG: ribokinase [Bacteroidales bacterium]|nr:ribokinase [Bacteroidales bacterium]
MGPYTKPKIVVVGSSNTDMIIKVPRIPMPGETILGTGSFVIQGGKGANQAVAAARAGGDVTFLACVGNDSFGIQALEAYKNEGINTDYIKKAEGIPTGMALINVSDSGENSISVAPGANSLLMPEDIDAAEHIIESASVLLMQLEIPLTTVEYVAEMALKKNIPLILNPAPAQQLASSLLGKITVLTPNEHEAKWLTDKSDEDLSTEEIAECLRGKGARGVVITLGGKGAYFSSAAEQGSVSGEEVKVVDTTAAGDTFNGYFAVGMAKGMSLQKSVELANKAAAISVTRMGAQPSIPFFHDFKN